MATLADVTNAEDVVDASGSVYGTARHKALREWLGISETPRELPAWEWVPNEEWRKLRGILSDHPEHDTTEMKARNRAEEEEHDARKFGSFPKR